MAVERRGSDTVNDLQRATVTQDLGGAGEQLRVEGVELVRVRVSPEGETIDAADDLERGVERGHDVGTVEPVGLPAYARDPRVRFVCHVRENFFHGLAWYRSPWVLTTSQCSL